MMKKQLLVTASSVLFILTQTVSLAESLSETTGEMPSNSNQMPMQGNMRMNNGMGNMRGMNNQNRMNRMQGRYGNKGQMNGHNCMGMKRSQNRMAMMNGQSHTGMMKGGCMNMSMQRHQYVMQNGISSDYQNRITPLQNNTPDRLSVGKKLYDLNCALCHGQTGIGDGPAGNGLSPKPANIAAFTKMPMASDAYLNWTISEGGMPINSPMPAFKNSLNEQQIWDIIQYIRTL
jgi:mono/diheme cytochrome c family protein